MSDLKAVSVVECYIQRSVDDELFLTDFKCHKCKGGHRCKHIKGTIHA